MDKKELATYYHDLGFNCAQSVFAAFSEITGISPETSLTIAGGFGGGLRQGEVCGAAAGAIMAIGAIFPFCDANSGDSKVRIAALTVKFLSLFREKCGALTCRDLLGCDTSTPEGAKKNSEEGIVKRLCPNIIHNAVESVEDILAKESK